jgi:hypothetical protein
MTESIMTRSILGFLSRGPKEREVAAVEGWILGVV